MAKKEKSDSAAIIGGLAQAMTSLRLKVLDLENRLDGHTPTGRTIKFISGAACTECNNRYFKKAPYGQYLCTVCGVRYTYNVQEQSLERFRKDADEIEMK